MEVYARLSSISDGRLIAYLKNRKGIALAAVVLVLAVILILFGSNDSGEAIDESLEHKVEELCTSLVGVGECPVMRYYREQTSRYDDKKVESVVIVCEGADSVEVRRSLTEMLSALFGIGSNRVRIEKMRK